MTINQSTKATTPDGRAVLGELKTKQIYDTQSAQFNVTKQKSFRVNTGNINNYIELKQKRYANSAEELCACLNLQFAKLPEDTRLVEDETLMLADKKHREPLYERDDLKITLKLFVKDFEFSSIRDAIQSTMSELQIDTIEQLIIAFPAPDGASSSDVKSTSTKGLHNGCANFESADMNCHSEHPGEEPPLDVGWLNAVLRVWAQIDTEYVQTQKVFSVGVADFNLTALQGLYNAAKLKPSIDHLNANTFCLSSALRDFAHENDIQLLTHNDPKPFPLTDVFHSFCRCDTKTLTAGEENKHEMNEEDRENRCSRFLPMWAARYTVWVRRRSLMAAKGYIVEFQKASVVNAACALAKQIQ